MEIFHLLYLTCGTFLEYVLEYILEHLEPCRDYYTFELSI